MKRASIQEYRKRLRELDGKPDLYVFRVLMELADKVTQEEWAAAIAYAESHGVPA